MDFVFNEWFLDWRSPKDSTAEERQQVNRIFKWLLQSEHRLVVLVDSPFMDKLNRYRKDFDYDPFCRESLKMFFSGIFLNRNKCLQVETPPLLDDRTEELLAEEGRNFASDRYLFQSAEISGEKIIVTTDQKLIEQFSGQNRFNLWTVEKLLSTFEIP